MTGREEEILAQGETIIGDDVVASIAGMAAKEVEGVAGLGKSAVRRALAEYMGGTGEKSRVGVAVEVGKKEAIVDLQLSVIYGFNIPTLVNEVRKKVAMRLLEITGLIAKEINLRVVSVEFHEKKLEKITKVE